MPRIYIAGHDLPFLNKLSRAKFTAACYIIRAEITSTH